MHELVKVSVVLPCKNAERTIGQAIESILQQSLRDFELIVIDESSDNSLSVIESITDTRLRVHHSTRLGLATSLNTGLRLSRGEYIARMDADDVSLPNRLSTEARYLDQHPEVGMVAGQAFFKQQGQVYSSPLARWISAPVLLNRLLFEVNPIIASASMIRRAGIMKVGGYDLSFDRWPYAEDYDLAVRISRVFDVIAIPEYVCVYTLSSSSMSGGRSMNRLIGLCIAKARSVSLAENPVDVARALISIVRSVEIDLTTRLTKNRFGSYLLNMQVLESKL